MDLPYCAWIVHVCLWIIESNNTLKYSSKKATLGCLDVFSEVRWIWCREASCIVMSGRRTSHHSMYNRKHSHGLGLEVNGLPGTIYLPLSSGDANGKSLLCLCCPVECVFSPGCNQTRVLRNAQQLENCQCACFPGHILELLSVSLTSMWLRELQAILPFKTQMNIKRYAGA